MKNINFLQRVLESINFSKLPPGWNFFDLETFSKEKKLWNFQQKAIKNAIKLLWKYYEDLRNFMPNENEVLTNQGRKMLLFAWYKDKNLDIKDINLNGLKSKTKDLLLSCYSSQDGKTIPYEHFINRMSFWMATGSGKTIVIVKLIQILKELMKRGEIPKYDILFLTHRDDLIEQFKKAVREANFMSQNKIEIRELKEYPEIKRNPSLLGDPIFYYRSDLMNDEQKDKIVDFRNYDNNGRWFIILDEAHKGDKDESKRQHIYSILSRNGFLFNFSATFTDPRDIILTAFEFNLASFTNAGYGKHIAVFRQEMKAFRRNGEYNDEEKTKIVLKTLILLTYVKKFYEKIKTINSKLYHKPLLLTLVNSINKEDADLKLFFGQIERIGKGDIKKNVFRSAIDELWDEFKNGSELIFENEKMLINESELKNITLHDILKYVYNSSSPGEIEISYRPSDKKQCAFKLTTSDKLFALIKTGDMPDWLKNELGRFNVNHKFEKEGYFEMINDDDSPISILMGSRTFYEGWDSNRPNVILFINIGQRDDAKKFILQSVGRGVRIEPLPNNRKRIGILSENKEISEDLYKKVKDFVQPLETLFILGTNRQVLVTVITELERLQEPRFKPQKLDIIGNDGITENHILLIPVYKRGDMFLFEKSEPGKLKLAEEDFNLLKQYLDHIKDDRILLMLYNTTPKKIELFRRTIENGSEYYKLTGSSVRNIPILIYQVFNYLNILSEEMENFKDVGDEIRHFKHIQVSIENIRELQKMVDMMKYYPKLYLNVSEDKYDGKGKDLKQSKASECAGQKVNLKYIPEHYYLPVILPENEKLDFIAHVIRTESEAKFIKELEDYLENKNKFQEFDYWFFGKLDDTLDEVYIPYYNLNENKISRFKPDFIFWLKKDSHYFIIFIDLKEMPYAEYEPKVNGYSIVFEDNGKPKEFYYSDGINTFKVRVYLYLHTEDKNKLSKVYSRYCFDNIDHILKTILTHLTQTESKIPTLRVFENQ